jgi:hypothetical protein
VELLLQANAYVGVSVITGVGVSVSTVITLQEE